MSYSQSALFRQPTPPALSPVSSTCDPASNPSSPSSRAATAPAMRLPRNSQPPGPSAHACNS